MTPITSRANFFISCGCFFLLLQSCGEERVLQGVSNSNDMTPHQVYAASLEEANLDETALGQAWFEAGHRAIDHAVNVNPPFREVGYMDPKEVTARGYRIALLQGQRLSVRVSLQPADSLKLFIDLYEVPEEPDDILRHVATADSFHTIAVEPRDDMVYLLRIQPELLRGGRYTVDIEANASLGFPVAGRSSENIYSFYGAPRDGGRRRHEGVDIFAKRGTPVVAISDGYVARIDETMIGGKVIWVRDAIRNQTYYYAHLDEFLVQPSSRVEQGDTLGLVGNTGNAINTPSHLHFGVYQARRPMDPFPFIHNATKRIPAVVADTSRLGRWIRVTARAASLKNAPYTDAEQVEELPRHTALRVAGTTANWYYVHLPDGKYGFIQNRLTEEADNPIRNLQLASGQSIRYRPSYSAIAIDSIAPNSQIPVFGEFRDFIGVTSPNGRTGWIVATD